MIVIWQEAPGIQNRGVLLTQVQERAFAVGHSLRTFPDYWGVLITGSGDDELTLTLKLPMRRRVPGPSVSASMFDDLSPLRGRHLPVVVHTRGVQNND
ncbi:MAG TPA: hypothetical protein VLM38_07130 [Blastocatellia bacterium]|nr:hypothetical protein [Blastocatellia bacterium]